ncbi:MAG: nucleotidyl transferase AbiEii/AbiGii toxin family protein [Dysgonamonadaceae bacterium]|jgi:predicted nucleotidyltransferase component of viral defense system|nr:nucleotidyl transferase AbiEii/AbiGii toxin family protein [Dysgonamonadaceae bacterium]
MSLPELSDFALVGGTALALRYGHRLSVDLDLFSSVDFDTDFIVNLLGSNFTNCQIHSTNKIGVFCYINDVKVDFVKYHYFPIITPIEQMEDIRIMGDKDLIAMKVNAILRRGVKKDFWDIAELMQYYPVEDFIDYYTEKYPNQRQLISIPRALVYFADAEKSENPVCLREQDWETVKENIRAKVNEFLMNPSY